jgi:hypothetical protein
MSGSAPRAAIPWEMHYVTGCMRMPSPPHGMIAVSGLLISWLPLPVSHVTHEEHGNGVMHCKPSINNPHPSAPTSGLERVTALFKDSYGIIPIVIASAPGRVNLIREHLDYNGDPSYHLRPLVGHGSPWRRPRLCDG